jgi:hypothetical protein
MRMRITVVGALTLLLVLTAPKNTSGEAACGWQRACSLTGGTECVAAPTSLTPMYPDPHNQILEQPTGAGNCGAQTCWVIFYCACGDPLASYVCPLPE